MQILPQTLSMEQRFSRQTIVRQAFEKNISGAEKAKTFASLSQPTSAYCRNSTGVSDTEEVQLHKEELGSCIKSSIGDL